jgi:tetratricopeptide (TPR) repeat protein
MSPVEWQDVEAVLAAVMDLPPTERSARIMQLCVDRPELRAEVESLLTAHEKAASFLEVDTQVDSSAGPTFSLEGKQLGPYRLLGIVGLGGMGTVYRAERTDGRFQKQVAIKVVPAALHSPELLRRFTSEQQILAALEHPNIARLLDAGVSPEGIPYFVMEYVEGIPVNEYCDSSKLSTAERLRLFQTLCPAVQYAHQHLVVHRDLKPANILVTCDGVPKLLDFGIAKIVDPWTAATLDATRSLLNPMTPGYASPEQVRGETVTTATDIYSLGVVLYELMTGQPPYRVGGRPLGEAIRLICQNEPEKPSSLVRRHQSATRKMHSIPGLSSDLDAIVAKAMRKDPQQRYASAEEFSSDIRRALKGLPVSAHRGSLRYRAGKFVRRHRFGVGVAAAAAVVLLGIAATMAVQAQRIAKERDRANREAEASKRVADFMTNMFKVSDPNEARGNSVTAREILDKASRDIDPGLARDPELQAQMMDVMGTVYWNLGLYSSARPLLEHSTDIRLHTLGPENQATLLSKHHLAVVLESERQLGEAEKIERETLEVRRRVLGREHPDTLQSMKTLGRLIEREGRAMPEGPEADARFAQAEKLDRETLDICRRVLGPEHPDTLAVMSNLGSTLHYEARYAEAAQLERETFEMQRRVLGPQHRDTMGSMNNMAFTLEHLRRYPEAERIYREALEIQRRVLGPNHPDTLLTMDNLNNTVAEQGRYAEAEKLCRETLEIRKRILGPEHPDTATSRYELAGLLARQGRRNEALSVLREAVDHGLDAGTDTDLVKEEDFNSLHDDPRFAALVAHARERAAAQKPNH